MSEPCIQEEAINKIWVKLSTMNGARWQIAFWVVAGIFIPMLAFYGTQLIANDRLRSDGDVKIAKDLADTNVVLNDKLSIIMQDVRELKTLIKINTPRYDQLEFKSGK